MPSAENRAMLAAKLRSAWSTSPREPMEVLSMLAGKSSYTVPIEGKSTATRTLDPADVAHALGAASDKLGSTLALAIACERPSLFPKVQELGLDRVLMHLQQQNARPGIVDGANRYRARLALYDVFQDFLWPRRRMPVAAAAAVYGMRRADYQWMHDYITGLCQDAANSAARDACAFLFARTRVQTQNDQEDAEKIERDGQAASVAAALRIDVLEMIKHWRPRHSGVLTLSGIAPSDQM